MSDTPRTDAMGRPSVGFSCHDYVVSADFARKLERENDKLRGLLWRCLPIIEADAQMMADIARHAPLDPASQAAHDSTEYESEKLLREIPAMLAEENV